MMNKHKVLIVDDMPENLGILFRLLSEEYDVSAAENGKVALDIVRNEKPDLILLDIMMPDLNGYEVIKELKANPATTDIPVIFVSALSENVDKVKGLELGAADYITKPYNTEEVLLRVYTQIKIIDYRTQLQNMNHQLEEKVKERTKELVIKNSQLKTANDALASSENNYRSLFKDAPDPIVLIDIYSGKIVNANPAAAQLFGYTVSSLIGKDQNEIFITTQENIDKNISVLKAFPSTIKNTNKLFSNIIIKSDGTKIPVESAARTIFLDGHLFLQGIMRDVSERKMLEKQLLDAKEKAEELNNIKSNIIANMSHELRTPLISILGFSKFLSEEMENDEYREMAELIHQGGNRLLQTINLLLDLSLMEKGKVTINESELDIIDLVRKTLSKYNYQIESKGLNLVTDFHDEKFTFYSDEYLISRIFETIISNAVKFTDNGTVSVKTSEIKVNEIPHFKMEIADSGIGIDPEKLDYIFQDFRQESEGVSRNYEGTGLGLTVANKLIEIAGGFINVTSAPGKGSLFTLYFPVKKDLNDSSFIEISKDNVEKNKNIKKIFYFEKDFSAREYTKIILEEKNYIVDICDNFSDSLKLIKENEYHLLLIDMNAGNSEDDNKDLVTFLKSDCCRDIPKIAVTQPVPDEDIEYFESLGFNSLITKPFDKTFLLEKIDNFLQTTTNL